MIGPILAQIRRWQEVAYLDWEAEVCLRCDRPRNEHGRLPDACTRFVQPPDPEPPF